MFLIVSPCVNTEKARSTKLTAPLITAISPDGLHKVYPKVYKEFIKTALNSAKNLYESFMKELLITYSHATNLKRGAEIRPLRTMKNEIGLQNILSPDISTVPQRSRRGLRRRILTPWVCTLCASLGIFGGISALFAGLICVAIHIALSPETAFDRTGTVLLIIAIPMILLGSVFLDEIRER